METISIILVSIIGFIFIKLGLKSRDAVTKITVKPPVLPDRTEEIEQIHEKIEDLPDDMASVKSRASTILQRIRRRRNTDHAE